MAFWFTIPVIDLETTGIPGKEFGSTKTTELSLISVTRDSFKDGSSEVPRALNKLTLCFHPEKFISSKASEITRLTNDMLEDFGHLDKGAVDLLELFVARVPEPACLLAHNGYKFDFPILHNQIKFMGQTLWPNLLCADTLIGFRALRVMDQPPSRLLWEDLKEEDLAAVEEIEKTWRETRTTEAEEALINALLPSTPPTKGPPPSPPHTPKKKPPPESCLTPKSVDKAKRVLNFNRSPSYALGNVYKHIIGRDPVGSHSAEGDTTALLEIVAALGSPFHDWVELNTRPFSSSSF